MKKLILITFLFCGLAFNAYSTPQVMDLETIVAPSDTIYEEVDEKPDFLDLNQFLIKNLKYPPYAQEKKIQGKVIIKFIVSKDGSITNIEVISSPHEILSNEAIRVIKLMPKWKPGILKGKPVNVQYTLPINFKLQ